MRGLGSLNALNGRSGSRDMNGEDVMAVTVVGSGWIALEGRIGGDSGMLEEGGNGRQGLIDNSDINGTSTYRQNGTLSTEGSRISNSPNEDARIDKGRVQKK